MPGRPPGTPCCPGWSPSIRTQFAADYWGRQALLSTAAELPGAFADLLSDDGGRRAGLRARAADPVSPGGQERQHARREGLHRSRRRRCGRRRPGQRRQAGPAVRRRVDDGAAGPAPGLAADHRALPAAGRRARAPGPGQRLRHSAAEPGLQQPLRRARRVRAADRGREAWQIHPRCSRRRCGTSRGATARPRSSAGPAGAAADRGGARARATACTCPAASCTPPPRSAG